MNKINFGKYALISPVVHTFKDEPGWEWTVKPVTSGDELLLSQFISTERIVQLTDGTRVSRPAVPLDIAIREVAITFGGTNIKDENDKLIITVGESIDTIEAVLKSMPHKMLMEIWRVVGKAIPGWGPAVRQEEVEIVEGAEEPKN